MSRRPCVSSGSARRGQPTGKPRSVHTSSLVHKDDAGALHRGRGTRGVLVIGLCFWPKLRGWHTRWIERNAPGPCIPHIMRGRWAGPQPPNASGHAAGHGCSFQALKPPQERWVWAGAPHRYSCRCSSCIAQACVAGGAGECKQLPPAAHSFCTQHPAPVMERHNIGRRRLILVRAHRARPNPPQGCPAPLIPMYYGRV